MAGAILERKLSTAQRGRVSFDVARKSDDAEIRRLLRENPMAGRISISLEREPSYFAGEEGKQTIVARVQGRVAGVGYCATRECFVNGNPAQVGYLGGLRLDVRHAGRFDVLRRGYGFLRELQGDSPADFYFTTIASDNARARRFLEGGIRGMPVYEFVGEFVTVVISTLNRGGRRRERASDRYSLEFPLALTPALSPGEREKLYRSRGMRIHPTLNPALGDEIIERAIDFVNEQNRLRQFAPRWSKTEMAALKNLGLNTPDFCSVSKSERIVAVGALWDQRCFKQTVIRGYAAPLALARPVFNVFARVFNQPRLPAVGEMLASAFASHFAVEGNDAEALIRLVGAMRIMAQERSIELVTLCFAASDPCLEIIRRNFGGREYRSRIYVVHWPGIGKPAAELDDRLAGPEVALL